MNDEPKALATIQHGEMSVQAVVDRKRKLVEVMEAVMKEGEHYGKIPGCGQKPALFKAGAEVLAVTFGLAPRFSIERSELPGGHREYHITCTLRNIASGLDVADGVGEATTLESKHRWRGGRQARVENSDPADVYNTVLKMAKKRAHVDAILTAVGASDILTQDLDDLPQGSDTEDAEFTENKTPPAPWAGDLAKCKTADDVRALRGKFDVMRDGPMKTAALKDWDRRLSETGPWQQRSSRGSSSTEDAP